MVRLTNFQNQFIVIMPDNSGPFFWMHDFKIFEIFFIAKSYTLRSNTPFLLNDDYQEVSIWPLNKPLKMAKWGFWFEHVIFLYKNAWFSSRQRRKKYFTILPGFCTKMHDFFFQIMMVAFPWTLLSLRMCLIDICISQNKWYAVIAN